MTDLPDGAYKSLATQLQEIYRRTLDLFASVELKSRKEVDSSGKTATVSALAPTPAQQAAANAIQVDYQAWARTVYTLLTHYSPETQNRFAELADLFSTYILFRRVGSNISKQVWRDLFVRESQTIIATQLALVEQLERRLPVFRKHTHLEYEELSLRFRKITGKEYLIEGESRQGEASGTLSLPFDERDIETFILKYCQPRRLAVRGIVPNSVKPYAEFGQRLFDHTLTGEIRDLFLQTQLHAQQNGKGLRIKLRLRNTPELNNLPWELLYNTRDFLCLMSTVSVTRYLDAPIAACPLGVHPPLNLLVTTSSPKGLVKLDIDAERAKLESSLAPLVALGLLNITFAPDGSLRSLQRMLRVANSVGQPYHLWHFIGHGGYDETAATSVLALEGEDQVVQLISGFELGTILSGYPALRLAVLNACEGARTGPEDIFSGVAASLVERGLPAAIAMQFEISDDAALVFSDEFYSALVDGLPVDTALSEARRAIFSLPNYSEWATPVLLMRVENGVVFDLM